MLVQAERALLLVTAHKPLAIAYNSIPYLLDYSTSLHEYIAVMTVHQQVQWISPLTWGELYCFKHKDANGLPLKILRRRKGPLHKLYLFILFYCSIMNHQGTIIFKICWQVACLSLQLMNNIVFFFTFK